MAQKAEPLPQRSLPFTIDSKWRQRSCCSIPTNDGALAGVLTARNGKTVSITRTRRRCATKATRRYAPWVSVATRWPTNGIKHQTTKISNTRVEYRTNTHTATRHGATAVRLRTVSLLCAPSPFCPRVQLRPIRVCACQPATPPGSCHAADLFATGCPVSRGCFHGVPRFAAQGKSRAMNEEVRCGRGLARDSFGNISPFSPTFSSPPPLASGQRKLTYLVDSVQCSNVLRRQHRMSRRASQKGQHDVAQTPEVED